MDAYQYVQDKQLVIFELDNVLFPEKDYLLQVYYLFAQFIEYTEQKNAQPIISFMQTEYENNGTDGLFEKTAEQFGIDEKYKYNFDLLHLNARLPLKLLLFKNMLEFMQELVVNRKQIFIVTAGNPEQQLNKIKQTEWNGLEQYLTVYFVEELGQSKAEIFQNILNSNNLLPNQALVVGANKFDEQQSKLINLQYIVSLEIYK
ncbi:HAD hydrolase-like protein [Pedobacter riviphilus]|uniref:HAD hydrolase-like protein n=1 Tax=Pedobacter riviphilus TaxID=2766984 RepID=A0ABX6TQL2_9SPHI|nr:MULTISPECIES: HAD hydrolase-like protein [Pedobacter]NMN35941.1 FMN phosphatase YigB (HAD superfamily) [Pedobacter sp. SG918]QNR85755.1 HAD hydrolase-like protein [Pedobacter riviphilus]